MFIFRKKNPRIKLNSKYKLNEDILNPKSKPKSLLIEIFSWLKMCIAAFILGILITQLCLINAIVPTGSMKNTIYPNNKLIASRLSYINKAPERFDIIVFKYPDNEKESFIKRIIGLPGETIEIIDGKVYINNKKIPLSEPYITSETPLGNFGPYKIPKNHYFVLGDNRNDSKDSRYWENKFVAKNKILGKVIFKYYPKFKLL